MTMTPSAPSWNAFRMNAGSTLPLHIVLRTRTFGADLIRETPARSAPVYEHQLQRNPMIFGSKAMLFRLSSNALLMPLRIGGGGSLHHQPHQLGNDLLIGEPL